MLYLLAVGAKGQEIGVLFKLRVFSFEPVLEASVNSQMVLPLIGKFVLAIAFARADLLPEHCVHTYACTLCFEHNTLLWH